MVELMISVGPSHCDNMISGKKVIEVRKSKPKQKGPYRVFIYRTYGKNGSELGRELQRYFNAGKVIGEFVCDKIEQFDVPYPAWSKECLNSILNSACLTYSNIHAYIGSGNRGYAWHISDLKIYDNPKELSEFCKPFKYDGDGLICSSEKEINDIYEWDCETLFKDKYPNFNFEKCKCEDCPKAKDFYRLKKPPQSWCYVRS